MLGKEINIKICTTIYGNKSVNAQRSHFTFSFTIITTFESHRRFIFITHAECGSTNNYRSPD